MASKVAESIRRGLEEAVAYVQDGIDATRYRVHAPKRADPRAIRVESGLPQEGAEHAVNDSGRRFGHPRPIRESGDS